MLHAYRDDVGYFEERADGLLASARDGTEPAAAAFARHGAPLTPDGARAVVAAEHGFAHWDAFRRHLGEARDAPFARAYRRIEAHDVEGLRAQLDVTPEVVQVRGTNGNDLLGMATATYEERLVALLLDRGADVTRANAHGWTPLHQAAYSGLPALVSLLLDAGAPIDVSARGDGGTPSDDPREVRDEALAWAARNDRGDAIEQLVARGADVSADVYRGTALAWAAGRGRVDAIRRLVALGADPDQRATFGGPAHGEGVTALHLAAQDGRLDAIDALLELGADATLTDALYDATPAGWAEHGGHAEAAERLRVS